MSAGAARQLRRQYESALLRGALARLGKRATTEGARAAEAAVAANQAAQRAGPSLPTFYPLSLLRAGGGGAGGAE